MNDHLAAMIDEAQAAARRIDASAVLLAASRDFRVVGSPWRFVFAAGGKTLFFSHAGEELHGPEVMERPYAALQPIAQPVALGVEEASKRLDDFPPPFSEVTLSFPHAPGATQPCYTFVKDDRVRVVGAMDGQVIGEVLRV